MVAWNRLVHDAVAAELAAGRLPILLGGDHCLGIGSISAVPRHCRDAGRKLRVLWLDAHADFNTSDAHAQRQPARHAGGLPVRPRPAGTDRTSAATAPALNAAGLRQIGIRSVDAGEKRFVHDAGHRGLRHALHRRDGHAPRRWSWRWPALDANTHLHVSFDVDFLDPDIAPGVGHHRCAAAPPTAKRSCAWR